MSVIAIVKIHGDTDKFRQALTERAEEFAKIAETGRSSGAIHHRFGIGDGYVLAVDEWESPQHFERFFTDPGMQAFMAAIGAAPEPPEVTFCEAIATSDQF